LPGGLVMELVAEDLPVRPVPGEVHFLQEHGEDALDRSVVRHLDLAALISGGVPDLHVEHCHSFVRGSSVDPIYIHHEMAGWKSEMPASGSSSPSHFLRFT